jgi:hypothetical protein
VLRKDGVVILLGVAGDEISPLPREWNKRLAYHGVLRTLAPEGEEDLRLFLTELGLIELSEEIWLHLPRAEPAQHYRAAWVRRLSECAPVTAIDGLQVLDTRKPSSYYAGRWTQSGHELNGIHIGRRRQRYGAPLWCLINLIDGAPSRFLDLASWTGRERPCDHAWRIQMAMDAVVGSPQQVRICSSNHGSILNFFSPLPSWAERWLATFGERVAPHRSLLAYAVPALEVGKAIKFLKDYLWITSHREDEEGGTQ